MIILIILEIYSLQVSEELNNNDLGHFDYDNLVKASFRYNYDSTKFEIVYQGTDSSYSLLGWNDNSFSYDYYNGSEWERKWDLKELISNIIISGGNDIPRYNEDTDSLDIYYNGTVVGSLACCFKAYDILAKIKTGGIRYSASQSSYIPYGYISAECRYVISGDKSTGVSGGYSYVDIMTNECYDFTNYNTLHIKISSFNMPRTVTFGISDTIAGAITTLITINGNTELDIDISHISDVKYLRFTTDIGKGFSFSIDDLYLTH